MWGWVFFPPLVKMPVSYWPFLHFNLALDRHQSLHPELSLILVIIHTTLKRPKASAETIQVISVQVNCNAWTQLLKIHRDCRATSITHISCWTVSTVSRFSIVFYCTVPTAPPWGNWKLNWTRPFSSLNYIGPSQSSGLDQLTFRGPFPPILFRDFTFCGKFIWVEILRLWTFSTLLLIPE